MGRKLLALVPAALPAATNLERFHADATDQPLLTVVTWSTPAPTSSNKMQMRTRQLALDASKSKLLELQRLQAPEGARSWFVGNDVVQDGGVTVFSPMEPLFVLLGAAWPKRTRFSSVDDLLTESGNSWLLELQSLTSDRVELLCDVQPTGGDETLPNMYVKASESKIRVWLRRKVERTAVVLAQQAAAAAAKAAGSGAFDSHVHLPGEKSPRPASAPASVPDAACHHREAIDVLSNYLPSEWVALLCKEFQVAKDKPKAVTSAKSTGSSPLESFRRFDRRQQPVEGKSKRPTPASAGSAKKKSKLANVDRSGMKSLTSFFGKK